MTKTNVAKMHTYRNLKHLLILNIMKATLLGSMFFFSVPLGSRCNLTSKKPTLFENHTMVLLYFVCVIINQFSAHLSSPVTIAHSLTRNFLKFVPKDRKNHRRKLQTNRQPSCFYPYEHLLALRTGGSRVPTYDQPPLIEARTQGWKLYSKCVKIYFERWNHRNPVI